MTTEPPNMWIDATKDLPPEGEYVLVHLTKNNWIDPTDAKGLYFTVAKLERGISKAEREKMKSGELPEQPAYAWEMPSAQPQLITCKRSSVYIGADEHNNNLRPYQWATFGPAKYFGQEVDYWMRIPPLELKKA